MAIRYTFFTRPRNDGGAVFHAPAAIVQGTAPNRPWFGRALTGKKSLKPSLRIVCLQSSLRIGGLVPCCPSSYSFRLTARLRLPQTPSASAFAAFVFVQLLEGAQPLLLLEPGRHCRLDYTQTPAFSSPDIFINHPPARALHRARCLSRATNALKQSRQACEWPPLERSSPGYLFKSTGFDVTSYPSTVTRRPLG